MGIPQTLAVATGATPPSVMVIGSGGGPGCQTRSDTISGAGVTAGPRTEAIARLAVTAGSAPRCRGRRGQGHRCTCYTMAGADLALLIALHPVLGSARIVAAAPEIALALGVDLDALEMS